MNLKQVINCKLYATIFFVILTSCKGDNKKVNQIDTYNKVVDSLVLNKETKVIIEESKIGERKITVLANSKKIGENSKIIGCKTCGYQGGDPYVSLQKKENSFSLLIENEMYSFEVKESNVYLSETDFLITKQTDDGILEKHNIKTSNDFGKILIDSLTRDLIEKHQEKTTKSMNVKIEDFIGVWEYIDNPNDENIPNGIFTIEIQKKKDKLIGKYCAITQKGNRIDCSPEEEYNFDINFNNNQLYIDFYSFFGAKNGKSILKIKEDKLFWEILKKPEGEYFSPEKAILIKKTAKKEEEGLVNKKKESLNLPISSKTIADKNPYISNRNIENISEYTCGENQFEYFQINSAQFNFDIFIINSACFDFEYKDLVLIKEDKILSKLLIDTNSWDIEKMEINNIKEETRISFEIDKDFNVIVNTKVFLKEQVLSSESIKYNISNQGKIIIP